MKKTLAVILTLTLLCSTTTAKITHTLAHSYYEDPGQAGRVCFVGSDPMTASWALDIDPVERERLSASNGVETVFVTGTNELMCVDTKSGSLLWPHKMKAPTYIRQAPTVSKNMCVVTSDNGHIIVYDIARCSVIFDLITGWEQMTSAVVGEDYLLVKGFDTNSKRAGLMAVNALTGNVVWSIGCGYSLQPPAISMGQVFVSSMSGTAVQAVNERNKNIVWEKEIGNTVDRISTGFGYLIVTTENGSVFAIDAENGNPLWSRRFETNLRWPATITEDKAFFYKSDRNVLVAVSISTGATIWEKPLESSVWQPQVDKERLILTLEREVLVLDQATGNRLWSVDTVARTVGNVLPINDHMILATSLSKLTSYRSAGYEIASNMPSVYLGVATPENPFLSFDSLKIMNNSLQAQRVTVVSNHDSIGEQKFTVELQGGNVSSLPISVDTRGKSFGSHNFSICIIWEQGEFSIPVSYIVKSNKVDNKLTPPFLNASVELVTISGSMGDDVPIETFTLSNSGQKRANFKVECDMRWLIPSCYDGFVNTNGTKIFSVAINTRLTQMGENRGTVKIIVPETNQVVIVDVIFERSPGSQKKIVNLSVGDTTSTVNGVRFRCRPAPQLAPDSKTLLVPLNFVITLINAKVNRWKGNENAPCKTVYYQLNREEFEIGFCQDTAFFKLTKDGVDTYIDFGFDAVSVDGFPMIPLSPVLLAIDSDMVVTQSVNGAYTFEVDIPEQAE